MRLGLHGSASHTHTPTLSRTHTLALTLALSLSLSLSHSNSNGHSLALTPKFWVESLGRTVDQALGGARVVVPLLKHHLRTPRDLILTSIPEEYDLMTSWHRFCLP